MKKICFCLLGCLLLFSCSDEFLKENDVLTFESGIALSPNTGNQTFRIYMSGLGNHKFRVVSSPDWLNIVSISEEFDNGEAIIICNASYNADFAKMGIYNDFIRLNVEDVGECRILVQYVEAGKNPKLEIEFFEEMVFGYYNDYWDYSRYKNMNIYNKGDGILFWQIISCPAWLNIGTSPQSGIVAPQYMANTITFFLTEDKNLLPIKKTFDTIIIQSNDEKSPIYKIPVFYRTVAPKMGYSLWAAYFDNNIRTTYFGIVNDGGEILEWEFTSYPQWINISQTKGNLKQGERIDLSMTAENDNFTEYITYGEITLISNDVNNLFRRIPVEYHNYP